MKLLKIIVIALVIVYGSLLFYWNFGGAPLSGGQVEPHVGHESFHNFLRVEIAGVSRGDLIAIGSDVLGVVTAVTRGRVQWYDTLNIARWIKE